MIDSHIHSESKSLKEQSKFLEENVMFHLFIDFITAFIILFFRVLFIILVIILISRLINHYPNISACIITIGLLNKGVI
jgi:type IV secretory pathway TrbL component